MVDHTRHHHTKHMVETPIAIRSNHKQQNVTLTRKVAKHLPQRADTRDHQRNAPTLKQLHHKLIEKLLRHNKQLHKHHLPTQLLTTTQKSLDQLITQLPKHKSITLTIAHINAPWQMLCNLARKHHTSLLMVETHGYKNLDHMLNTTTTHMVNHAPCSMLIMRKKATR